MLKKYFTLLEILVALCIVSLSLFSLVSSFSLITSTLYRVKNYTQAMCIAGRLFFETSQKLPESYSLQEEASFNEKFFYKRKVKRLLEKDIFKIRIDVFWKEGPIIKKNLSFVSYVREK